MQERLDRLRADDESQPHLRLGRMAGNVRAERVSDDGVVREEYLLRKRRSPALRFSRALRLARIQVAGAAGGIGTTDSSGDGQRKAGRRVQEADALAAGGISDASYRSDRESGSAR